MAVAQKLNGVVRQINPGWYRDLIPGYWQMLGDLAVGRVKITPESAALILDNHNTRNRKKVESQIALIQRDMDADTFLFSGETIIFDWDRILINGQNRLYACHRSGKAFETLVVVGIDPEVFKVLDQQSRRTVGQILEMAGEVKANNLSSAIKFLAMLTRTGEVSQRILKGTAGLKSAGNLTVHERLEILAEHPTLREAVAYASLNQRQCRMFGSSGLPAALCYLTDFAHRNLAKEFWQGLIDCRIPEGERWQGTSLLLKKLVNNMGDVAKFPIRVIAAYVIKAFNLAAENKACSSLQYQGDREEFPKIHGLKYVDGKIVL